MLLKGLYFVWKFCFDVYGTNLVEKFIMEQAWYNLTLGENDTYEQKTVYLKIFTVAVGNTGNVVLFV